MGITIILQDYEKDIFSKKEISYKGLKLCELGNQNWHVNLKLRSIAKDVYTSRGTNHTSIDINGEDGSLQLDLCKSLPEELFERYDVVTNYGTGEHVENQYELFKNIHNLCKIGGLMIHAMPKIGNWKNHCDHYYTELYFKILAEKCGYKIYDLRTFNKDFYAYPRELVVCVLIKTNKNFIDKKEF